MISSTNPVPATTHDHCGKARSKSPRAATGTHALGSNGSNGGQYTTELPPSLSEPGAAASGLGRDGPPGWLATETLTQQLRVDFSGNKSTCAAISSVPTPNVLKRHSSRPFSRQSRGPPSRLFTATQRPALRTHAVALRRTSLSGRRLAQAGPEDGCGVTLAPALREKPRHL